MIQILFLIFGLSLMQIECVHAEPSVDLVQNAETEQGEEGSTKPPEAFSSVIPGSTQSGPGDQGLESELDKIRDPFKKPDIASPKVNVPVKEELERFVTESYRLVGVITGPSQLRAMLVDSEGKTHFVTVGTKIGSSGGIVASISADRVKIRERKTTVEIRMP